MEVAGHGLLIILEIVRATLINVTFVGPVNPCAAYHQGCGSVGPPI